MNIIDNNLQPKDFTIRFEANCLDKIYIIHIPYEEFPALVKSISEAITNANIYNRIEIINKEKPNGENYQTLRTNDLDK